MALEAEQARPDFWSRSDAARVSEELGEKKAALEHFAALSGELAELQETASVAAAFPADDALGEEAARAENAFEEKLAREERVLAFSGPYDRRNALVAIFAGAGGRDAADWAAMLARMYERFALRRGWEAEAVYQSLGEEGGLKTGTFAIRGKFAYGLLRGEAGVHRLVRISPFSPQKLRHTSFAKVEVLPDIGKDLAATVVIKPDEIKVDTFRSSGPGGQNVNKRETAVRITHTPTGSVVASQIERSQAQNKERALELLRAKLYQFQQEHAAASIEELRTREAAAWGRQRRSYVLQPYQLVKDLKTGAETSDVAGVLDGNLDEFIEANLK